MEEIIKIPEGKYIAHSEHNFKELSVQYKDKKKIALIFVSINQNYWPYLLRVIQDARLNFLPHHNLDILIWSDAPEDMIKGTDKDAIVFSTEPIEWPHPTLMRYHLFLQQEEKLREYDYVFYLDADMRIVDFIGDEILGEGLTVAEHPMYALKKEFVPPYEPNKDSMAYIPRFGVILNDEGKPRFKPIYAAGGVQGGITQDFIEAMKVMKKNIDKDLMNNYIAIWNDESHWNRYLLDYKGKITLLSPAYVYPDSEVLIKPYYEVIWGRSYKPKIITLTKPFTLTKEGGAHVQKLMGQSRNSFSCPTCKDNLEMSGYKIISVKSCPGSGKPHQSQMVKI